MCAACLALGAQAGWGGGEGSEGFRFVHLSDLHCAPARRNPPPRFPLDPHRKDLVRSFQKLEAAVRHINAEVRPDFVVVTGDLVDRRNDVASLRRVKRILSELACPYYPVIGDHDGRAAWRQVFGPERLDYAFTYGEWRFLALDVSGGRLRPATLAWLGEQLEAAEGRPTAILVHRPLVVPEAARLAARRLYGVALLPANAARALEMLDRRDGVRAVFAGHCHLALRCERGGVEHHVAPALAAPGSPYHVVRVSGSRVRVELRRLAR